MSNVLVGRALRNFRRGIGKTQYDMAEALGISYQQVQKYESGNNRISVESLIAVCEAFNVQPSQFFEAYRYVKGE